MREEQKELYFYTKDRFYDGLKRITPNSASPIIATRKIVKASIEKYITEHCSNSKDALEVFSEEDFQAVSNRICDEIMRGEFK